MWKKMCPAVSLGVVLLGLAIPACARQSEKLKFQKGDHICYIGNTLADRTQHHGWLETLLQYRFSDKELVFRNLGFAADKLNTRPRSQNFGSPDKHLAFSQADVIFAFFGYNESFNGEAGLNNFRKQLADFIDHTLSQKYNGQSAPPLVLFSPIAHEDLDNPNLPDGKANNARLEVGCRVSQEGGEMPYARRARQQTHPGRDPRFDCLCRQQGRQNASAV